MTRFGWLVVFLFVLIVALVTAFYMLGRRAAAPLPTITATSSPVVDPSAYAIYSSGTYGFTFFYPADARLSDSFTAASTTLPWRENAIATGTLIVTIGTHEGDARIGMSTAKKEVSACTSLGVAEKPGQSLVIGSTTWTAFVFDHIGTDNPSRTVSYRTLHDAACYALETTEPLQVLATSTLSAPDAIIRSFTFAHS